MVTRFQTVDRATPYILPQSIEDWLPEDHLARFVVEVVSKLDLAPLRASYAGRGSTPYDPGMLLSLLFYGYATGVRSSRKIEAGTHDSVAFRYIAANSHPDHDTIASFRLRFLVEIGEQPRNRDETAGKNQPDRKGVDSMSVFLRVTDIFKANVNDMLDRMEDPEKMVKQMIIEMEEALVKATSGLAKAMANEQNLRKQQTLAMTQAKQWEDKAALALRAGNADLAKLMEKMNAGGGAGA